MKFDKQNLIKHRFWLLLGAIGLFFVLSFLFLALGSAGGTEEKEYKKASSDLTAADKTAKHADTYVPKWDAHTKALKGQKEKAWELAWGYEKDMLTWPEKGLEARWQKAGSFKDFKAWVDAQQADRTLTDDLDKYRSVYKKQFDGLDQEVAPAEFYDLLKGFDRIMAPATSDGGPMNRGGPGRTPPPPDLVDQALPQPGANIASLWDPQSAPKLEEAWIAQEDFCIKSQIVKAIGSTIKDAARLQRGPAGFWSGMAVNDKPPPDAVTRFIGHNSHWELDLIFVKKSNEDPRIILSPKSTLKNVDVDRRTLAVSTVPAEGNRKGTLRFRVTYKPSRQEIIEFQAESLAWGKSVSIDLTPRLEAGAKTLPSDIFFPANEIVAVDQVLDWYSSPVRIIEDIRIPALSHRMADVPLKPGLGFIAPPPPEEAKPAGAPGQPGATPPAQGTAQTAPRPDAAPAVLTATDINKLDRLRYIHVTEQSRHVPFGIALIVEKNHVPEVLAALANTHLRVQITQVLEQRVRGVPRPRSDPLNSNTTTAARDDDANLVELVVYGVCTLYERVPDNTEKPKQ